MIFTAAISYFASFLFVQVLFVSDDFLLVHFVSKWAHCTKWSHLSTCDALTEFPFSEFNSVILTYFVPFPF